MPLADILAPQIAKKAKEIAADLGPPDALLGGNGYLQGTPRPAVGLDIGPATVSKPQVGLDIGPAAVSKPQVGLDIGPAVVDPSSNGHIGNGYLAASAPSTVQGYDPRTPAGMMVNSLGMLQRSDDPYLQAAAQGIANSTVQKQPFLIPNAAAPEAVAAVQPGKAAKGKPGFLRLQPGAPVAASENGTPVYAAGAPQVIQLPQGAVGVDEAGRAVDKRGHSLGYLPDPNVRDAMRHYKDVAMDEPDAFATAALQQMYGAHLRAMQDNRDRAGMPTDQFPPGYFDGMSAAQRKNITAGVKELMKRAKGVRT